MAGGQSTVASLPHLLARLIKKIFVKHYKGQQYFDRNKYTDHSNWQGYQTLPQMDVGPIDPSRSEPSSELRNMLELNNRRNDIRKLWVQGYIGCRAKCFLLKKDHQRLSQNRPYEGKKLLA